MYAVPGCLACITFRDVLHPLCSLIPSAVLPSIGLSLWTWFRDTVQCGPPLSFLTPKTYHDGVQLFLRVWLVLVLWEVHVCMCQTSLGFSRLF